MIAAAGEPPGVALGTIDLLLRDRALVLARIQHGSVAPILRTMIATIAIAMAIVGAALGSYRGGEQTLYAAIKLPLVLLGTAALSAPALTAIGVALGRRQRFASDLALVMSSLAFGALLLCACTPLIMLGRAIDLPYHQMILLVVGCFAIAGIASLKLVIQGLASERSRGWFAGVFGLCIVFTLVGGQLSWALRPYLVRPRATEIVFVRDVEGSLFDAVTTTLHSTRGVYFQPEAPLPEARP